MNDDPVRSETAGPSSALKRLGEALVGSWVFAGGATGQTHYAWAPGGLFLVQQVEITVFGRAIRGMEMIGHQQDVGEEPSPDIVSRFYSYTDGLTLDYVYELEGRTLVIWFQRKDSGNRFVGQFDDDGRSYKGAWAWPGGGYDVIATRLAPTASNQKDIP